MAAPESKVQAEALIPLFQAERILNQDQNGRRLTLLGAIKSQPALLTLERASFPTMLPPTTALLSNLTNTTNLGANDIYRWYMSNVSTNTITTSTPPADLKLNLIYPCTPKHITKYTRQPLRHVTETPQIYTTHIHPYIYHQRTSGRLDWIFNILDGHTEQEDVIMRSDWDSPSQTGFLLLPDLNWDRKTVTGLHLLALVQRRDIWSLRDLKVKHVGWLRELRGKVVEAAARAGSDISKGMGSRVEEDELKCYVHYHPTYYHFHVHVVHVMFEAEGGTQSVGKAWELGGLIGMLEGMKVRGENNGEKGLADVDFSYVVGEESELWKGLWGQLKVGKDVTLNQ